VCEIADSERPINRGKLSVIEHGSSLVLHRAPEALDATILSVRIGSREALLDAMQGAFSCEVAMCEDALVVSLDTADFAPSVGEFKMVGAEAPKVGSALSLRSARVQENIVGAFVNESLDPALVVRTSVAGGAEPIRVK
jgi:hypothetical protein